MTADTADFIELSEGTELSLSDFLHAVTQTKSISIGEETLNRMDAAFEAAKCESARTDIYGVSTGLGPMIAYAIKPEAALDLQYNLLRSHAAGMGEPLSIEMCRGVMLARLQSLLGNRSAVRGELAAHIAQLLNAGIAPFIPRKGGVGASGDLVQLAHLGLLIIGEGACWFKECKMSAREAYSLVGLQPLALQFRDGLALVNGTSVMTAMGAMACGYTRRLLDCTIDHTCLLIEILGASMQPYAAFLQESKRHAAQKDVARRIREHLMDAGGLDSGRAGTELQAPYSIRCAPQLLGAMYEGLAFAERAVFNELNSISDNPVFDPETGVALHGGNFHGEPVAFAMDVLKIAVVKCSLLLERQLNLVLNDSINGKLPPFLNLGRLGVELGLQGAQFTATSTAAENQSLAFPMSLHTIPSNKDNQDIVSMGANAAWITLQTIDNAFDIAAILAVALSQGVEAAGVGARLSSRSHALIAEWRAVASVFRIDAPLSDNLTAVSRLLKYRT